MNLTYGSGYLLPRSRMILMPKPLSEFLTREQIESIRRPIGSAWTFPAIAYTDEGFYQLEIEKIYKKRWVATLFDFDVLNAGDLRPFDLCNIPLLAVRGNDGQVRVFHNICPYDGCLAVIDPAEGRADIVTPYHGWTYDLEGKLLRTPYWDGTREGHPEALQDKEVDLVPVPCEVFMNTVFVNLSGNPEVFEDYIAPIFRSLGEYDLENSCVGHARDGKPYMDEASVKTNWKTFFENACVNVLHENFVHALYAASPELPRIKEDGVPSYANIIDDNLLALSYNRLDFKHTYPHVEAPHLGKDPDHEPLIETFGTLYPNFYISASSQSIEIAYVLPDGPGESVQRVSYHFQRDVALAPEAYEERKVVHDFFYEAFMEDGRMTEAVQKARNSPVYSQKFYAPFWDGMHHRLNQIILDDLEA